MSHLMTMPKSSSCSFITIFFFFILSFSTIVLFPSVHGQDDELYTACRNRTFDCGVLKNISYPFWWRTRTTTKLGRPRHCGHQGFELTCIENQNALIKMEDQDFRVLEISKDSYTITIARADLFESPCTSQLVNTTLDYDRFYYPPSVRNLTLYYGCVPANESIPNNFTCEVAGTDKKTSYFVDDSMAGLPHPNRDTCYKNISVPIVWTGVEDLTADALMRVLGQGFQVAYTAGWDSCAACLVSNGMCGSNATNDEFLCFCGDNRDKPYDRTCSIRGGGGTSSWKRNVIIGVIAAGSAILLWVLVCCIKRTIVKIVLRTKNDEDLEAFIRNNGPLAVKRYRYSEIRKMTNSFKDKLGQGGYGDVYKGKLPDGCLVAVKVLKASKGNGEDFINEVASIRRTSHVNVVTLLGYCYQGQKKALIYEFMPNGSLEKYIYKGNSLSTTLHLEVAKLFEIAIGIARGLEYLHRGCNIRIMHFDIKPHNILLDEDFCPKISDFGLSKLCLKKESVVSMLDARGTIGYIAPEVFCRNFGRVSVKSDVYSYGMMILEIVGGTKNVDARVSHTSEIYFPDWVYQHLEPGSNLGLPNPMSEDENEVARKMILVGLWCIQTKPSDRPSMSKVIEMLEGSIEALQMPPKPILTSPPRTCRIFLITYILNETHQLTLFCISVSAFSILLFNVYNAFTSVVMRLVLLVVSCFSICIVCHCCNHSFIYQKTHTSER